MVANYGGYIVMNLKFSNKVPVPLLSKSGIVHEMHESGGGDFAVEE